MGTNSKRKLLAVVAALAIALSVGGGFASDASAADTVALKVTATNGEPVGGLYSLNSVTWCRNC